MNSEKYKTLFLNVIPDIIESSRAFEPMPSIIPVVLLMPAITSDVPLLIKILIIEALLLTYSSNSSSLIVIALGIVNPVFTI